MRISQDLFQNLQLNFTSIVKIATLNSKLSDVVSTKNIMLGVGNETFKSNISSFICSNVRVNGNDTCYGTG